MARRTILLIVAALIAVAGSGMVFLYVRSADDRAIEKVEPVQVLKATGQIEPGETANAAMQAGKMTLEKVPRAEVLVGAVDTVSAIGSQVALQRIFPGEQIVTSKFGSPGDQEVLSIPDNQLAMSVSLSDPGRVAGFVNPGSKVTIFVTMTDSSHTLLKDVPVLGVGATTVTSTTTTTEGGSTTEQLPRTLLTLAVTQQDEQRILLAQKSGELAFGLQTDKSEVRVPFAPTTATNLFQR